MRTKARKLLLTSATIGMLVSTAYFYDNSKPVLDYMEYLPVYRVEQLWERKQQQDAPGGTPFLQAVAQQK